MITSQEGDSLELMAVIAFRAFKLKVRSGVQGRSSLEDAKGHPCSIEVEPREGWNDQSKSLVKQAWFRMYSPTKGNLRRRMKP